MTCDSLRDAIVDLARCGDVRPGTSAAIESHVEHCAACAALIARERHLSHGLRALAAATAADGPSDALGPRLLEAFVARHATPRRARWETGWMRAAAAVLVSGVAATLWWSARGPATEGVTRQPAQLADAGTPDRARLPALAPSDDRPRTTPVAAASRRPGVVRRRLTPAASIVRPVGFVAVPGAAGLPDFESGQIIRLEIPLTSLPTYGIEILPDAQGLPVEADLLVGQDGQARAIRLVTTAASR